MQRQIVPNVMFNNREIAAVIDVMSASVSFSSCGPNSFSLYRSMQIVTFSLDAANDLRRHGAMAKQIRKTILSYMTDSPDLDKIAVALVGCTAKRLRVGEFSVIFEETETARVVTKIGPRGGRYA